VVDGRNIVVAEAAGRADFQIKSRDTASSLGGRGCCGRGPGECGVVGVETGASRGHDLLPLLPCSTAPNWRLPVRAANSDAPTPPGPGALEELVTLTKGCQRQDRPQELRIDSYEGLSSPCRARG